MKKWEAIDLCCGLGGWTEGLMAEGFHVVGYDIEEHKYGDECYPGDLVLEDVLQIHGSRFAHVDLIVASPPCQEYSYMAMPWSLAKAKRAGILADETGAERARLNRIFDACFRIQREASEAAGRHIPLVVENVRGAQEWVGKAVAHFGSYYLWGDVPLPLPDGRSVKSTKNAEVGGGSWFAIGGPKQTNVGGNPDGRPLKVPSLDLGRRTDPGKGARFTSRDCGVEKHEGTKQGGDWFNASQPSISRLCGSKSVQRKAASAKIAKIPLTLSRHVALAIIKASWEYDL